MLPPRVLPNITNSQQYLLPNFTAFFRTYNHIYASKFGKLSNGHRTGKSQFSFQSQGKAMPRDAQAQFSSVAQSCLTLSDPMDCST